MIWVGQVLPVGTVAYLIKKFYRIPYFVSTHGMDIMLPQRTLRKEKLMRKILTAAEFITANSQFTATELANLSFPEEKIKIIYPCPKITPEKYPVSQSRLDQLSKDLSLSNRKVLLTVGRLVERKGHDTVLKLLPQLSKSVPEIVYLVVGDGPYQKKLVKLVSQFSLQDKVKFIGQVKDEDLSYYYRLADLFVMPTRDIAGDIEGFGIVYLEAASFGLPVVAVASGGSAEAVIDGQTGLLSETGDVSDLIAKINLLLSDKNLYQQMSEAATRRVKDNFAYQQQTDSLKQIIINHFHAK